MYPNTGAGRGQPPPQAGRGAPPPAGASGYPPPGYGQAPPYQSNPSPYQPNPGTGYPPPAQGQPQQYPPVSGQPPPQQYPPPAGGTYPPPGGTGAYPSYPPPAGAGAYPPPAGPGGKPPPLSKPVMQTANSNNWHSQYYQQMNPQEMMQMQQQFRNLDPGNRGSITAHELAGCQLQYGVTLGPSVAAKLVKVFDQDNSGTIDFVEFATLHGFLTQMQKAFAAADADRSGTIDAREIFQAISGASFNLTLPTVQMVVRKYDHTLRGLSMMNFVEACADLAQIRSIFEWNDRNRSGSISLTLDQLAAIIINVK